MLVQRITRVEIRGEPSYRLNGNTVNVTITSPELSGSALTATERQIESGMRQKADEQFRDVTVNLPGCSDPNAPSSMVTSLTFTPLKFGGSSADGQDFSGTLTDALGGVTTWTWSMRGEP